MVLIAGSHWDGGSCILIDGHCCCGWRGKRRRAAGVVARLGVSVFCDAHSEQA